MKRCYGKQSDLRNRLNQQQKLLEHAATKSQKQCLPIAPFECKTHGINDFDIRTHKDFHKYTLAANVIPPAGNASDYRVESHPDFAKYKREMDKLRENLAKVTTARNETAARNRTINQQLKQQFDVSGQAITETKQYKIYKRATRKIRQN